MYSMQVVQEQLSDEETDVSPMPASSESTETPTPVSTPEPPARKKRKCTASNVDKALMQLSKSVIERRSQKEKREAENCKKNTRVQLYGMEVAETLSRLPM